MNYASLWSELRTAYASRRPLVAATGDPLLIDDDLVLLLSRWTQAIDDQAARLGARYSSLRAWWLAERSDVARGDVAATRARRLWASTRTLARLLSDAAPRAPRNAAASVSVDDKTGQVRVSGGDWAEIHIAVKKYFSDKRGYEEKNKYRWPKTTNGDVRQLLPLWNRAAASARLDVFGVKDAVDDWKAMAATADQATVKADPNALYPDNEKLWHVSSRLTIEVSVGAEEPEDVSFWDALAENVEKAPARIAEAAGWAGNEVEDLAKDAAGAAAEVTKVALGPLKPWLIGAGVLGAGVLAVVLLKE